MERAAVGQDINSEVETPADVFDNAISDLQNPELDFEGIHDIFSGLVENPSLAAFRDRAIATLLSFDGSLVISHFTPRTGRDRLSTLRLDEPGERRSEKLTIGKDLESDESSTSYLEVWAPYKMTLASKLLGENIDERYEGLPGLNHVPEIQLDVERTKGLLVKNFELAKSKFVI